MKELHLLLLRVNDRKGAHPFLTETNVTGIYPPLGLAYLAACARKAGFRVAILDAGAQNLSEQRTAVEVARLDPAVIGFSATTFNWPVVVQTANRIRRLLPEATILVGGPQLSLYPQECLSEDAFNLGLVGEGENALVQILQRRKAHASLIGIPGTFVREEGSIAQGPKPVPIEDLDSLPLPALELLPLDRYRALTLPSPFVSIVTSRGCPYRCRYCSQVFAGGVYREHGAARVVEEMTRAKEQFGAREIVIFDETFAMNLRRAQAICTELIRKNLGATFNARTRADLLDETTLEAMAAAGCRSIHVGIESGSDHVQTLMNKNLDLGKVAASLGTARRLGIRTRGYFMIGFPGETLKQIEQTIDLATRLPLDWASFTITFPHPGTEIYAQGLAEGRYQSDYWRDYTLGRSGAAPGYFTSDQYDAKALEALLKKAYRRFYLRPKTVAAKMVDASLLRRLPGMLRTLLALRASPH